MSFFDGDEAGLPGDALPDDRASVTQLPGRWLGGFLPIDELVGRTAVAAVAIRRFVAYTDGFEFETQAWLRNRGGDDSTVLSLLPPHYWRGGSPRSMTLIRFGIEFPDRVRVSNATAGDRHARRRTHGMQPLGGSSEPFSAAARWFAWPLPPEGQLRFVCEMPGDEAVEESSCSLDCAVLFSAAANATPVWPDEPPQSHRPH